jgi:hypothetical protein
MEDINLLPSIEVIPFRLLYGWGAAHRARGDGITWTFSTKAWYAAFLLSKNFIIGPTLSQAGPALFN